MESDHDHITELPKKGVIIAPRVKSYHVKVLQFGSFLAGHPYGWNKTLQRSEFVSPVKKRLWWFNMAIALIHATFVIFRAIQISFDESADMSQVIFMRFCGVYFCMAILAHTTVILSRNEISVFANQYLDFVEKFEQAYGIANSKPPSISKNIGTVMQMVYLCINAISVLMALTSIALPQSQEQVSSLLPNPADLSFLARVPFALFLGYIEYIYHSSIHLLINCVLLFGTCLSVLTELSAKTAQMTSGNLREYKEALKTYRLLLILSKWFNQIYCEFCIPMAKAILILMCVYCTYGAITMDGVKSYALGLVATLCFNYLFVLFMMLSEFHSRTQSVKADWNTQTHLLTADKWYRKVLESLPDITVRLRGMYFVDRGMVMTMLDGTIDEIASFLLLNR